MPVAVGRLLAIPDELLEVRAVRASGPGGQNVNKVSNAVELRFDAAAWDALPPAARPRLRGIAGRRMTADGLIVIDAKRFRSLEQNRAKSIRMSPGRSTPASYIRVAHGLPSRGIRFAGSFGVWYSEARKFTVITRYWQRRVVEET